MTDGAHTRTNSDLAHGERLFVPWWDWPVPLIGAGLLAAQVQLAFPDVPLWLPYALLLPLAAALLLALGRVRVALTADADESQLWVGDAHLPLRYVAAVDEVPKEDKRRALGPELDPAAFCVHRPWVRTMVRVHLDDPRDPTPYWLISTRHPARLAALLREGAGLGHPDGTGAAE
ncbi:DUF3093 domain-containing protein [Saccharomonospora piscinae]|uniref:DUF3093 domain-containing protein n=1 Tax=Saccharomonospora piscinae TaxID=687388 RepID=UPI000465738C|nr:DUF3093 domain-containing protein [Saccharomonospora piscinae]